MMVSAQPKLCYFKDYARFLSANQVDAFAKMNVERAIALELPLLSIFKHSTSETFFETTRKALVIYLDQICNSDSFDDFQEKYPNWWVDKLPGIDMNLVPATDLILFFNARKYSFLEMLESYTSDAKLMINIIKEIEDFYASKIDFALQKYTDFHQIELLARENRLKEVQKLAQLGFYDFEYSSNTVTWSDELYDLFGIPKSTPITPEVINNFVCPLETAKLKAKIDDIYESKGTFNHEYSIRRSDGEERLLLAKGYVE